MNLCSRDFRKWGEVDAVLRPPAGSPQETGACGPLRGTGDPVYVPTVFTIEGGHCVRVNAPVAEISAPGVGPAARLPEHALAVQPAAAVTAVPRRRLWHHDGMGLDIALSVMGKVHWTGEERETGRS